MEIQGTDDFIEQLLKEKGITDIEPDVRAELKEDMKKRLLNQINKTAVIKLNEEKAAELATLVDDPNFTNEQMAEFMKNSGVNLSEVALITILRFRSFYLGLGE